MYGQGAQGGQQPKGARRWRPPKQEFRFPKLPSMPPQTAHNSAKYEKNFPFRPGA